MTDIITSVSSPPNGFPVLTPTAPAVATVVDLGAATLGALESVNAAVSGTVELGNTTMAALETINAIVDRLGQSSRSYNYAAGQLITTTSAAQVRSAAITATEITLSSTVDGYFRVGDASVSASIAAGSQFLAANSPFTLQITSGQFVSFIRAGADNGNLSIVPVA